jgi:threonine/homoserine/homoserine lactone efflux protein
VLALLSLALSAYVVGFSGALAPGPLTAMTIAESARRGFRAGPLLTLGHALAEIAIVIALAAGLNRFFKQPLVSGLIAFGGGLVLLWMGVDIARSAWRGRLTLSNRGESGPPVAALDDVRTGILVSIANPYWILWWATVGATYVVLSLAYGVAGMLVFYAGHIMSDLTWNSILAFAVSSGRGIISDKVYRGALLACGVFLVVMGVTFVWAGVGFLRALG